MQVVTTLIMVAYLSVITGLVAFVYFRRMLAIVTAENHTRKFKESHPKDV